MNSKSTASTMTLQGSQQPAFTIDHMTTVFQPSFIVLGLKSTLLFSLGALFSLMIDHLQTQHNVTKYPEGHTNNYDGTPVWFPVSCGFAAIFIGLLYPYLDYHLVYPSTMTSSSTFQWFNHWLILPRPIYQQQRAHPTDSPRKKHRSPDATSSYHRQWSSVIRCIGGFIGVNYAASKLPWTSSFQVSITLALLAMGLWYLFDRTWHGFLLSLFFACIGTWFGLELAARGAYAFTKADFFGVRSWLPCVLYCGGVCFGVIGRQLEWQIPSWSMYVNKRE